jgi:SAM-dependent methyltransferase
MKNSRLPLMDQTESADSDLRPKPICPICHSELSGNKVRLTCQNPECHVEFPVVDGIPVLINEANSIFSISNFEKHGDTFFNAPDSRAFAFGMRLLNMLPSISESVGVRERYNQLTELLLSEKPHPTVLVVGGSIVGQGMSEFLANPSIHFVETDISFGPRTQMICDGHDLPFQDGTFDAVIAQYVLEHVVDPHRCVDEMHRVLKEGGIVYAETPFMQQVHGGRYDFLRFTYLGHRRLFRHFTEVASGVACGPGMALSWAWAYFALSLVKSRPARAMTYFITQPTSFWLRYLDRLLNKTPGAFDAASAYYFLGRRSNEVLPDRELIKLYKGGHR